MQAAAPSLRTGAQVVAANANWSTSVLGTTPDYLEVRDWPLAAGRSFEAAEMAGSGKVAVIGQTVAQQLFGDADPIDQTIRVRKVPLQVIGVLDTQGPELDGPGPGRRHRRAAVHLSQPHAGHERRAHQARRRDQRQGARRPEHAGGRARRSASCCASATACKAAPTTTSASAT